MKKTLRLPIDPADLTSAESRNSLTTAAALLRHGGLVAMPTETVYGLGANAFDPSAVEAIFLAKNRPSWDPVIVHIAGPVTDNPTLQRVVRPFPDSAQRLMRAFWPGPLTLLLPRSGAVPDAVTAGRPLVGVRMPAHPVAFALIQQAGVPVAAPSANLFSHISPTTADHVLADLDGRIDAVLDAGPTHHGVESTVLDPCQSPMIIYRPGAITADQIRSVAGDVQLYREESRPQASSQAALPAPGVGLRHYAPRAHLILLEDDLDELPARLSEAIQQAAGQRIGIMLPKELPSGHAPDVHVFNWGSWNQPEELARNLYAGLRWLDEEGCGVILCPLPRAEGVGLAIRDRLRKAARRS